MLIESSAPTRIDLAGGTLDIWPLYLFHERAQTLNAAISLRAYCSIRPRTDNRLTIVSEDTGVRVEVDHWSELRANHDLKLLGHLLHFFQAEGLELRTRSDSPFGAGIAGSSALNIAVCGALAAWCERQLSDDLLMQIAQNVEAQVIDVPTGVQDYRPALYGGISARYLTGDGARRDEDGYFWIVGRIDDVLNVAGHRLGTSEIESALVSHPRVAEAAVVGRPDELKGQGVVAFVTVKTGVDASRALKQELREHVGTHIGAIARPDEVRFAEALPKTRSGKIMRRLLKEIASGAKVTGDTTTLEDFSVLAKLAESEE